MIIWALEAWGMDLGIAFCCQLFFFFFNLWVIYLKYIKHDMLILLGSVWHVYVFIEIF